jgi:hypothetical protein
MAGDGRSEFLLEHLERDLGRYGGRGVTRPESDLAFSLLQFDDRPEPAVTATVTFGVSTHLLRDADGNDHRQELLLLLRRDADDTALQIAANVGSYVVDGHVGLLEGETVAMPAATASALDTLVAAGPEPFPARFARCEHFTPPLELIWLLPFAMSEWHLVVEHGWRELFLVLRRRGEAPWDLGRATVM